jgi:hypothetical protein
LLLARRVAPDKDEPVDELRAIRSAWDDATRAAAPACGLEIVQQAYTTMQAAWFDELGVHIAILEAADVEH